VGRIPLRLVSLIAWRYGTETIVEDMPKTLVPRGPRGPGDNPKTALHEFLRLHPEFQIDADIPNKLLITVAPDGYLRRVAV
jgi:cephalosporin hydroxylase